MDGFLENLATGFGVALSPENLGFCFVGVLMGTVIGVLPGIGPVATIALLLPVTFNLDPASALIMLAGIYYGAQYGGSAAAILLKIPGEAGSVVTALDGHPLALKGRAGEALAIAAIGSFIAGTIGTLLIAVAAPPLAKVAQAFGPAEYASLILFGLVLAVSMAAGSRTRAVAMAALGVALGLAGTDVFSGAQRFTLGIPELADGFGFAPLAMGLFGLAEMAYALDRKQRGERVGGDVRRVSLTRRALRKAMPAILRGTGVGAILGVLPGGGAILSSLASYALEKRISRTPEEFGRGAMEGVAGPESANNAGAQTSFIPMMTLGVPTNAVMALMIGAMMIQGIQPGPLVLEARPELFWGMVASMWIGNLLLLVINLPLIGIWVRLLDVKPRYLFPAVVLFMAIGAYAIENSWFDVVLTAFFGVLGYVLLKLRFELSTLVLGFVLGPMLEENFRRAMIIGKGDMATFVERPLSLAFIVLGIAVLALPLVFRMMRRTASTQS